LRKKKSDCRKTYRVGVFKKNNIMSLEKFNLTENELHLIVGGESQPGGTAACAVARSCEKCTKCDRCESCDKDCQKKSTT
jgi:hypothetical protein